MDQPFKETPKITINVQNPATGGSEIINYNDSNNNFNFTENVTIFIKFN